MTPVRLKPGTTAHPISGLEINKMLVRIANREDSDQTASSEAV